MAPKFGATKFRNAVPTVPHRDAWYRTGLSSLASDAPSNTSAFSSVLKTNRESVLTLTPGGEASVRSYSANGENESAVWSGKIGNNVADWDVSRLEDGGIVVAGSDGNVSYYTVDGVAAPTKRHSFQAAGRVSNISLHPTTPGLALVTSTSPVVAIYDVAASTPAITLKTTGDVALWAATWSADGRLVGGVGKKGQAYIWDARAGSDAVQTKDVSMQPLKPARVAFVGGDLFVTSFSRTRSRQYSLLSASAGLSATFIASVDNSQGPLVPLVDEERGIVYTIGRGDMRLRQIELTGSLGYQEVPHVLPSQVTSGSIALSHWSTLPVMEAQVATVLLPTQDKDGEAILPLAIKVPRRQLIDYHGDLYPDVVGSVPEQTVADWFKGGDNAPLPVSLDPERRDAWQKVVEEGKQKLASGVPAAAVAVAAPVSTPAPAAPAPAPAAASVPTPPPVTKAVEPVTPPSATPPRAGTPASVPTKAPPPSLPASVTSGVPPLEPGESYASTSYKIRNIGERVLGYHKEHVAKGIKGPLMVGLQGPQGCGKTTLCDAFLDWLRNEGLRVAVLSLDDLYRTHAGLKQVASDHPNNSLLSGRGPPGTHDVDLATTILEAVKNINSGHVDLPVFDKSLCNGEGDRSEKTVPVDGPLDIFLLEGWSFGFAPVTLAELEARYAAKDGKYFPQHSLASLEELNDYLATFAAKVYPYFSALVQVEPTTYEYVFRWRLQQEHAMKAANGGNGMTDDQVHQFVERYMPAYELWAPGVLNSDAPWAGHVVRLGFGEDREILSFETPESRKATTPAPKTQNASEPAPVAKAEPVAVASPVAAAPLAAAPVTAAPVDAAPAVSAPAAIPKSEPTPKAPAPVEIATPAPTTPAATSAAAPSGDRYNPGWSRKYVAGKSPLNPTYDQVPAVVTLHQDSVVLRTTPHLALFPIQGPGGRICVHPLSKKGRLPVGGVGYLSGGVGLADFAADPFGSGVVLAGEDGVLRVWSVGPEGVEGPGPEPEKTVRGHHVDKISQIAFHPTAKDLLVAATNDLGKASLRFFDLEAGTEAKQVTLDIQGITGFAIASAGGRIAVATKDSKVAVLDPRDPSTMVVGKAHDSPRGCQLAWVDETHFLSIGFGRGSMRKINLYAIGNGEITTEATQTIDVSPGVLFPVYDVDTNILYVWGKGERAIQAFEVHPGKQEAIAKLPAYTGSSPQLAVSFLAKPGVDVRKVEVAKCLRLTSKSIEEVSFSIPRNKPAFFQDDIYVPTVEIAATTTASKWLAGDNASPRYVDLKPADMELLSQAPATTSAARTKFVPAANVMSEEEKKRKEMDDLFQRAKADLSSDDEDEPPRSGLPPPDDDW